MKLIPESVFGWIFIFIFVITQIASNPDELLERLGSGENFLVLLVDYLIFPIATGYLLFFVVSNIYQFVKPKNKENNLSKTINKSKKLKTSEILEKELEELEEVEKINLLTEQINEKRKSLNLNSKEHFDQILINIKNTVQNINQLNEQYLKAGDDKKFFLKYSFIYGVLFLGFAYLSFNSDIFFFILFAGIFMVVYLVNKYSKYEQIQLKLYQNIQDEKIKLKDLRIEKKKNEI